MREILFRGQTRRYGEKVRMGDGKKLPSRWVYGGVLQGIGSHSIIYGGENMNDPSEGLDKWPVYTDTLGQYTGLKDKNGKRIFEGDILRHENSNIYSVIFAECGFNLRYNPPQAHGMYFQISPLINTWNAHGSCVEVIGNIYDNPELLDGGEAE